MITRFSNFMNTFSSLNCMGQLYGENFGTIGYVSFIIENWDEVVFTSFVFHNTVGNVNSLAVPVPRYKLWSGRLQLSQKQYRATSNMPVVHGKAISKPGFLEAPGVNIINFLN